MQNVLNSSFFITEFNYTLVLVKAYKNHIF